MSRRPARNRVPEDLVRNYTPSRVNLKGMLGRQWGEGPELILISAQWTHGSILFSAQLQVCLPRSSGKKNRSSNSHSNSLYKGDSIWSVEEQLVFCFVSQLLNGNSRKKVLSVESLGIKDFDVNMTGRWQELWQLHRVGIIEGSLFLF